MVSPLYRWLKLALINLMIVATLGVILRYKILYPLPFINQKHLLHGHSHFAFAGWVTQALMTLLVIYLAQQSKKDVYKKYRWLIMANLFTAYGMLVAFPIQGYGLFSIIFSTASILVSYFFAFIFWRDLNRLPIKSPAHSWFKAAVLFNALASLGAFALTIMMIEKTINQKLYLAAEYFYLHFQYNGFFSFSCIGLTINKLPVYLPSYKYKKIIFILFFSSCIPAYFLSILWVKLPVWLYGIVVLSAFTQIAAWYILAKDIRVSFKEGNSLPAFAKFMFLFVGLAVTVKLLLQLGSTVPEISKLAFGFRPVVIAYLHLVLLAVISVFLLAYFFTRDLIQTTKKSIIALSVFLIGVFLNEVVLAVQGVASFSYIPIKHINEILFIVAVVLVLGAVMLVLSQSKKRTVN